ncbi:hypothetical protein QTI51_09650 [Variovorax sp. J22G73]|uniref:hypothetical protein n=1 Tax=unclassified Variovorax TaxID=663243 RepID=UPI002578875B|nr:MULTISPECIES: hypothetical protein [unclassified Variovorax]MDM0006436.1 hypothetical protein [Variovorax sp. J22R203]MDM0097541.1 hypothetical protein [Variovorax sp. J22G73]
MTTKYRIMAHAGQVTAIIFGREHSNAHGVEVAAGDADDLAAEIEALCPTGVGSPWPPVGAKPAELPKPVRKPKGKADAESNEPAA